jgi:nicotinate phosphoribosyltransferase
VGKTVKSPVVPSPGNWFDGNVCVTAPWNHTMYHIPTVSAVIRSLLTYKFTMQQPMLHSMPTNQAEYHFVCRNTPAFALAELQAEVNAELDALCELRFTEDELAYLGAMRFLSSDYIDFLRLFQFQRRFITVHTHGESYRWPRAAGTHQGSGLCWPSSTSCTFAAWHLYRAGAADGDPRAFAGQRLPCCATIMWVPLRCPFEFLISGVRRRSGAWQRKWTPRSRAKPQFFKAHQVPWPESWAGAHRHGP